MAGTFAIVNKHLINDLLELGLWNNDMRDKIILENGSIQNIPEIPDNIKVLYKTVWELSQKVLINLAADRAPFICQTQSLNLFVKNPTYKVLTSMHFYAWERGLKTGIYYLRSLAKTSAQKFSVDIEKEINNNNKNTNPNSSETNSSNNSNSSNTGEMPMVCNKDDPECLMCSS